MDKKIIKGLIDEKLEVIQEQFSVIKAYEGKIPAIELDLIMGSIRDLYELVLSLQVENISIAMPKTAHEPETVIIPPPPVQINEPEDELPEPIDIPVEQPEVEISPVFQPLSQPRFSSGIISMEPILEEKTEEAPQPVVESQPSPPEPPVIEPEPPEPEPEPEPEPFIMPEQEKQQQRITFDLFSSNAGNTLADRLREGQENKVADLRSTIGINDKFLFINELFEGNMRIYDDAIQKLNTSFTVAQADLLMLDLKIAYNWDSESPTVKKFVDLVRRRF